MDMDKASKDRQLKRTPELVRKALQLKEDGLSYDEIAKALKVKSKGTISKWIAGADKFLVEADLPSPSKGVKGPNALQQALNAVVDLDRKIGQCDGFIKRTKGRERREWEKLRVKLIREKRQWMSLGVDWQFTLASHFNIKEAQFRIKKAAEGLCNECKRRFLEGLSNL